MQVGSIVFYFVVKIANYLILLKQTHETDSHLFHQLMTSSHLAPENKIKKQLKFTTLFIRQWKRSGAPLLDKWTKVSQIYEKHVLLLFTSQWVGDFGIAFFFGFYGFHWQLRHIETYFTIHFCGSIWYGNNVGMVFIVVYSIKCRRFVWYDHDLNNIVLHLLLLLHRDHLWSLQPSDWVDWTAHWW